jgi:anaerobic selenocysteine-containing dehydrogenase
MNRRNFLQSTALAAAATLAATNSAVTVAATESSVNLSAAQKSKEMSNANERVITYIAVWNERDAKRRRELVEKTWTENGTYIDAHRRGEGHDGIDAMIAKAQSQFPGYQLRLKSGIEAHNGHVRFSWYAGGTEQAPFYLGGTDFCVMAADGRFQSVTGFVDAAPAR